MLFSKITTSASYSLLKFLTAYDNNPGWKMNADNTAVEIKDGHPVYIGSDGKEMIVKGDTISSLRGEAKTHREAKEALEAQIAKFKDIDPDKAREAFAKLSQIDQKQLIDAGKVDEVKATINREWEGRVAEKDKGFNELKSKYDGLLISNVFAGSEFVRNNLAIPRDMFESFFAKNFKVEGDKVVAYGKDGNQIMSKKNVGEFATPEEALEILVDQHPQKEVILKADVGTGSGNSGNSGNSGAGRTMRRSEFEKLNPIKQVEVSKKVASGEMKLVD